MHEGTCDTATGAYSERFSEHLYHHSHRLFATSLGLFRLRLLSFLSQYFGRDLIERQVDSANQTRLSKTIGAHISDVLFGPLDPQRDGLFVKLQSGSEVTSYVQDRNGSAR